MGTLYLCATPIGNLEDITLRVLRTLKEVDLIAAEDTRQTIKLLNHFDIKTPLTSYHEHNKFQKTGVLVNELLAGKKYRCRDRCRYACDLGSGSRTGTCCLRSRDSGDFFAGASAVITRLRWAVCRHAGLPSKDFSQWIRKSGQESWNT